MYFYENNGFIVLCIAGGVFTSAMTSAILVMLYPEIMATYNISLSDLQWRNILFFDFFALLLPFFSKVSAYIGGRRQFIVGLSLFTFAALASGNSRKWEVFLFFQSLQAVADSMIISVLPGLIRENIQKEKLGWAYGIESAVLSAAVLVGPPLGAMITLYFGWQFIFYLLAFFSFSALLMFIIFVPSKKDKIRLRKGELPFLGTLSLFLILLGFQILFSHKNERLSIALVIGGGILFLRTEFWGNAKIKIFPKKIWKSKEFLQGNVRIFFIAAVYTLTCLLVPLLVRSTYHLSLKSLSLILALGALIPVFLGAKIGKSCDNNPLKFLQFGLLSYFVPLFFFYFYPIKIYIFSYLFI